jgi:F420-non-reducing hydrogenase iron-sulfur subunit
MSKSETIVVFVCNWDAFSCVDSAAQKHMTFPASVKIIRVSCLSRVHTGLLLTAFELGAEGVMLLGCDSNNCHFGIEEDLINQSYQKTLGVMRLLGIKQYRLALVRLPHGDGAGFIKRISEFSELFTGIAAR